MAGTAVAREPSRVSLDFRALDEREYRRINGVQLERETVLRLLQDGFTVTPTQSSADVEVRVAPGFRLEARGVCLPLEKRVDERSSSLPEFHLEVSQKVAALVRACLAAPAPLDGGAQAVALAPPAEPPQPATGPRLEDRAEPTAPKGWQFGLHAGGGVALRAPQADPMVHLGVRLGWGRFLGQVHAAFVPASAPALSAMEWQVQAGPAVLLVRTPSFELELGLVVGALLHQFTVSAADASDSTGARWDVVASLPLAARWRFSPSWDVSARVAPGAGRPRSHLVDDVVVWRRGAFRLELSVVLAFSR